MPFTGRAFVGICPHRPQAAFNQPVLGHVAWGYEYPDGSWCVGTSEGPDWHGIWNGFWQQHLPSLDAALMYFSYNMRVLSQTDYDYYKLLEVNNGVTPNCQYADQVAQWVSQQPYVVFGRNCMNDTYDVLRAYAGGCYNGSNLPTPETNWIPNGWFNAIVSDEYYKLPNPPSHCVTKARAQFAAYSRADAGPVPPPSWRKPGSPEFIPTPTIDPDKMISQDVPPPTR